MNPSEASAQSRRRDAPSQAEIQAELERVLGRPLETPVTTGGVREGGYQHPVHVHGKPLSMDVFEDFLRSLLDPQLQSHLFDWEKSLVLTIKYNGWYGRVVVKDSRRVEIRTGSGNLIFNLEVTDIFKTRPPAGTVLEVEITPFSPLGEALGHPWVERAATCMLRFPIGSKVSVNGEVHTISTQNIPHLRLYAFRLIVPGCFLSLRDERELMRKYISTEDTNYLLFVAEGWEYQAVPCCAGGQGRFVPVEEGGGGAALTVEEFMAMVEDKCIARSLEGLVLRRGDIRYIKEAQGLLPYEVKVGTRDPSMSMLLRSKNLQNSSLSRDTVKYRKRFTLTFLGKAFCILDFSRTRIIAVFEKLPTGCHRLVRVLYPRDISDEVRAQLRDQGFNVDDIPASASVSDVSVKRFLHDYARNLDGEDLRTCFFITLQAIWVFKPWGEPPNDQGYGACTLGPIKQVSAPLRRFNRDEDQSSYSSMDDVCSTSSSHWLQVQSGNKHAIQYMRKLGIGELPRRLGEDLIMTPDYYANMDPVITVAHVAEVGAVGGSGSEDLKMFENMRVFFSFSLCSQRGKYQELIENFIRCGGTRLMRITQMVTHIVAPPGGTNDHYRALSRGPGARHSGLPVVDANYFVLCINAGRLLPLEDRHFLYNQDISLRRAIEFRDAPSQAAPAPAAPAAPESPAVDRGRVREEESSPPEAPARRRQARDRAGGAAEPVEVIDLCAADEEAGAAAPAAGAAASAAGPPPVAAQSPSSTHSSPILGSAASAVAVTQPPPRIARRTDAVAENGIFKNLVFLLCGMGPQLKNMISNAIMSNGGGVRVIARVCMDDLASFQDVDIMLVEHQSRVLSEAEMGRILEVFPQVRFVMHRFIEECVRDQTLLDWWPIYDVYHRPYPDQGGPPPPVASSVAPRVVMNAAEDDNDETQVEALAVLPVAGRAVDVVSAEDDNFGDIEDLCINIELGVCNRVFSPHQSLSELPEDSLGTAHRQFVANLNLEREMLDTFRRMAYDGDVEVGVSILISLIHWNKGYVAKHPEVLELYSHRGSDSVDNDASEREADDDDAPCGGAPGGVTGSSLAPDDSLAPGVDASEPDALDPSDEAGGGIVDAGASASPQDEGSPACNRWQGLPMEDFQWQEFCEDTGMDMPAKSPDEGSGAAENADNITGPDAAHAEALKMLQAFLGVALPVVFSTKRIINVHVSRQEGAALKAAMDDFNGALRSLRDDIRQLVAARGRRFVDAFMREVSACFQWELILDHTADGYEAPASGSEKAKATNTRLRNLLCGLQNDAIGDATILSKAEVDSAVDRVMGSIDWQEGSAYGRVRVQVAALLRDPDAGAG